MTFVHPKKENRPCVDAKDGAGPKLGATDSKYQLLPLERVANQKQSSGKSASKSSLQFRCGPEQTVSFKVIASVTKRCTASPTGRQTCDRLGDASILVAGKSLVHSNGPSSLHEFYRIPFNFDCLNILLE